MFILHLYGKKNIIPNTYFNMWLENIVPYNFYPIIFYVLINNKTEVITQYILYYNIIKHWLN